MAGPSAGTRRRWTINGDFLGLKPTGVARYGREITTALDALIGEGDPLARDLTIDIVAPQAPREALALHHIGLSIAPELRLRLPQVWVQMQLPRHVPGGLLSFCNLAPVRLRRQIVCIHDLQTRTTPDSYGRLFRLAHRIIQPALGRRAAMLTTVSDHSKATLAAFGIAQSDKIAVVPNGSDHAERWQPGRASTIWPGSRPFALCIGRNEAHKNMGLVWRLAPALDRLGLDIVVVGDIDPARYEAAPAARPANLHLIGRVSDDDLARGFGAALCFLFPSRTEGFGLPAVEAMACGCPVIASTAPCLPDICGRAALFADPDDVEAWATAIRTLRDRPDVAGALRAAGRLQAGRYTWRNSARAYLRLMLAVDRMGAARLRSSAS